jgi:N-methylhydantoinase B
VKGHARLSIRGDKHRVAPHGREGGRPGRTGRLLVNPGTADERELPSRVGDVELHPGDVLRVERPGGGGLGAPWDRDPALLRRDLDEGYVTAEKAWSEYGVRAARTPDGTWAPQTSTG